MVYCVRAMRPTVAGSHPGRDLDTFPDRLAYRFTVRALEEAETPHEAPLPFESSSRGRTGHYANQLPWRPEISAPALAI